MFTVSFFEMRVIANVAFSAGSSQHGNARLAAVGCGTTLAEKHAVNDGRADLELR